MKEAILERFLRYVAVTSQSDGKAGVVPSTEGQRKLAGTWPCAPIQTTCCATKYLTDWIRW